MVTQAGPVTSIGGTLGWWGNGTFITATPILTPQLPARFPTPETPGLWHIRLTNLPSGWVERFILVVPVHDTSEDIPLLVAFHRFGNTMWDIVINTQLPREANIRQWYLLAPLGASDISFSSMESQMNTEVAIELITELFNVDTQRIYGIGHSMGGGNALNYAARHVDPKKPMFAGLINHTGALSQRHSYDNDCDPLVGNCNNRWLWEFWYGGTSTTHLFEFLRTSVIDVPYQAGFPGIPAVDPRTDLARNLTHIPIQSWMASNDPLPELIVQNLAFEAHMNSLGAPHQLITIPSDQHTWALLDYKTSLDWLGQQTLQVPLSGRTLADQDGTWFHFDITQDRTQTFSPFEWIIDQGSNTVSLLATENIARVVIDALSSGLDVSAGSTLTVRTNTADSTGDEIRITPVNSAPSSILRDGIIATSWRYDASTKTLAFSETESTPHTWTINF